MREERTEFLETPVGMLEAVWSAPGQLYSCSFVEKQPGGLGKRSQDSIALQHQLDAYFAGQPLEFDLAKIDWSGVTNFNRRVLTACWQIEMGSVVTYGELAKSVGAPQAARAVGRSMATNRWPLFIPCHRVVGASGKMTGYSGTGGIETKRRLLELERGQLALV